MPKNKESKADEYYLGQIRELKKEVKSLKQVIRALEKQYLYHGGPKSKAPPEPPKREETLCKECGKGKLVTVDIVGRVFVNCALCGYRKKVK